MKNLIVAAAFALSAAACGGLATGNKVAQQALPGIRDAIVRTEGAYALACPLHSDDADGGAPAIPVPEDFCVKSAGLIVQLRATFTQLNDAAKAAQ